VTVRREVTQHSKRVIECRTVIATYARARLEVTRAGSRVLALAIRRATARRLTRRHAVTVTLRTVFTPRGGAAASQTITIVVKRAANGHFS
jgi:hypothetical protein